MSLKPPDKVRKLRETLHAKAKGSPDYRFYSLYDKIHRKDVLIYAYACCKAKGGAAGVDAQTFEGIETYGQKRWLDELEAELEDKTYRPEAVRRVYIPKPDGKKRPLGIPTIKDRVAQTAAVIILEPVFETDLQPEQYAYRRGRNAIEAVGEVHKLLKQGYTEVIDADLSGYFDTIPHAELIKSVSRRVSDGAMLKLIKMWLQMPVQEEDEWGNKRRTARARKEKRGIPQGAPISPLLSNLYMRRFILGWKVLGHQGRLGARIVNYADDFVICCRGTAHEAMVAMRRIMEKLKLTVNETKTRICRVPEDRIEFLGYSIGQYRSWRTGRAYLGVGPSKEAVKRVNRRISDLTKRRTIRLDEPQQVGRLNRLIEGWANYYCLGTVSRAYRAVDSHARRRLRQWLCGKHKIQAGGYTRYPDAALYRVGLRRLAGRPHKLPWAYA